jgi:hypothetical protein
MLKSQIPAHYIEFSMFKFIIASVVTVALGYLFYEAMRGSFKTFSELTGFVTGYIT